MTEQSKALLRDKLIQDYQSLNSLTKLSNKTGLSKAYLSQIINDKLDPGESAWTKLSNYYTNEYVIVETENAARIYKVAEWAMQTKSMYCIIGKAGAGKSTIAKQLSIRFPNAFYLECQNYSQKVFLEQIAKAMYINCEGTNWDFKQAIRKKLSETPNALLVLDEASQLNDNCLIRIKEIYGDYHSSFSGIILLGTESLEKNLIKSSKRNKRGFAELFDRIQHPFIHLKEATEKEAINIMSANGVDDPTWIANALQKIKLTGSFRAVEGPINHKRMNK